MYTKWILAGVLATVFVTHHLMPAHAQQGKPVNGKPAMEQDMHKLVMLLNLTPEQHSQLKAAHEQYFQGLIALKSQKNLSEVQIKQRAGQLREQALSSLKKILTASQIETLNQHGGMGVFLGEGKHAGPFDLLFKLDLTPQQAEQIKRIIGNAHQAMDQLKAQGNLPPDQLKMRMEQIHQQAFQEIHAVLTPAQLRRLMEMHHDQGGKVVPPGH